MEPENPQIQNSMSALEGMLIEQFPEIETMSHSDDFEHYDIEIKTDTSARPFIRSLNEYIGRFLLDYSDQKTGYSFVIQRGRELIDILRYHDDTVYYIELEIEGQFQRLRVLDVMGASGDFSVFNEDFENLGTMFTEGSTYFGDGSIWETNDERLKPYINNIVAKISEQHNMGETELIDPENECDMEFYAEQFEITTEELKKAIESVGTSIFAITQYLEK